MLSAALYYFNVSMQNNFFQGFSIWLTILGNVLSLVKWQNMVHEFNINLSTEATYCTFTLNNPKIQMSTWPVNSKQEKKCWIQLFLYLLVLFLT